MKQTVFFSPLVRRLCALLALGELACLLCACSMGAEDPGAEVALGSTDLLYEDGHVSGELCEGVVVDADIPDLSAVTSYDIVSAHLILPDEDVIQSMQDYVFAGYSEDEIAEEHPEEYNYTMYDIKGELSGFSTLRRLIINYDVGYNSVCFDNFEQYPFYRVQYDRTIPILEGSEIERFTGDEQEDLGFMKKEEAVSKVEKQLREWKINPIGEPLLFHLDGNRMYEFLLQWNEEHPSHAYPLKEEAVEALDCYYMIFDTGYNGIPYTCFEFAEYETDSYANRAQLELYFTKDGIVGFNYSYADYEIDGTLEEHDAPITLDQALSQVRTRYEDLVVTSAVEIENIFFQYVPQNPDSETGSVTLVPAWVFQPKTSMTVDGEVSEFYQKIVVVHAITGEVISL